MAGEVNDAFRSQVTERRRVTEEERTRTLKRTGLDLDTLIAAYQDQVEAQPVEAGARVGVDPGETLVTAGRTFSADELARIHELGTSTIQQREHFRPVWRRFRTPDGVARVTDRIREEIAVARRAR